MSNSFKLHPKHFSKKCEKFSCAPCLRACLLGGQLCPVPKPSFQPSQSKAVACEAGGGRRGAAAPPAWNIQGKLCFQGKHKLLENAER